jgi:drug/metabolite transporter (DMT)-like permease
VFTGYALAVLAAASNAASSVLQRKANRDEPAELSMRAGLILDLLRRPVWLAGFGAVVVSFVLLAAALSMGQLAAIQPVVVMELPLTLIGAAWVLGAGLSAREWAAAGVMTAGLAGLLASLDPSGGNGGDASGPEWAVATGLTVLAVAAVVGAGLQPAASPGRRTALLGVGTGMAFGLTSAFMKGMTAQFRQGGLLGVVTAWQTYAMIAAGLGAMFLLQNALHAGRLVVAQPGITLADPVVAIVWGVVVFHESTRTGWALLAAVAAAAMLAAGAVVLARSPLLAGQGAEEEEHKSPGRRDQGRHVPAGRGQ